MKLLKNVGENKITSIEWSHSTMGKGEFKVSSVSEIDFGKGWYDEMIKEKVAVEKSFQKELAKEVGKFSPELEKSIIEKGIPKHIYCGRKIFKTFEILQSFFIPVINHELLEDHQVIFDWTDILSDKIKLSTNV